MASKQPMSRGSSSSTKCKREIMRPIISSDVMGNRNVEVVPVGAWVEPADDNIQPDAVMAAKLEEQKIQKLKEEKENRLRSFQQKVKQRVSQANRLKRQQQIQEAEEAFERERRVVQQSCLTGEMPRRDTCLHRQDLDMAIRKRLLEKYGEDILTWENDPVPALQSRTEENHETMNKAREQLVSKKIAHDDVGNLRVNGEWKAKVVRHQNPRVTGILDLRDFPAHKMPLDRNEDEYVEEESDTGRKDWKRQTVDGLKSQEDGDGDVVEIEIVEDDANYSDENEEEGTTTEGTNRVQFSAPSGGRQHHRKKRPRSAHRPRSAQLAAILSSDKENDILARQRRQQAAISRRIFMEREREAVRENIRRQQHRQKIKSLKKEKEEYRQQLEEISQKQLEPTDPVTGETADEARLRERMEALQVKEMVDRRKDELRRVREMERYLDALRHNLIEKAKRLGLQLPSLCACGENVWDTHPETCANNCFFYRNPRAYARALQSLLSSVEVM